jgi:alkylation response protein AidB-like acyl-CoA dehydrogenase
MHFALTEEEELIRDSARKLAADRLAPLAERLDRGEGRAEFLANLKLLAENGFMALNIQAGFGGTEASTVAFALTLEELAAACASTAVTTSVTNYPAGAFCLTEAGAGSDPAGMKLRARRDGDAYVLDGQKIFITSGEYAGLFVVWGVTDPEAPKGKGISVFLVPADTPGVGVGKAEKKMGQTGSATNTIHFDGARVPAGNLMGKENDGFRVAVGELAGGRIGVAAVSLGIARAAMDAAKSYARERKQFGQAISEFQGLQWLIADRELDLHAARLLILDAAAKKDRGEPFAKEASMAKLFASEAAHRCTDAAIQIHGGAGYCRDFPVERYARDARITRIYEGTSEIQRLIIARETLRQLG